MARYRGPKTRIARKFGEAIFGYDSAFERRKYPPGQHGVGKRRKQPSEYGIQLKEKQKAKYTYGLLERQFSNLFEKASRKKGVTGVILLQLLESRLDNTVYRLGFASTRRQARQLVNHKHIMVNGKLVNIPSYTLKPSDVISVRTKSRGLELISSALSNRAKSYSWLELNETAFSGKFVSLPEREDIPENINEQLIVEIYSK